MERLQVMTRPNTSPIHVLTAAMLFFVPLLGGCEQGDRVNPPGQPAASVAATDQPGEELPDKPAAAEKTVEASQSADEQPSDAPTPSETPKPDPEAAGQETDPEAVDQTTDPEQPLPTPQIVEPTEEEEESGIDQEEATPQVAQTGVIPLPAEEESGDGQDSGDGLEAFKPKDSEYSFEKELEKRRAEQMKEREKIIQSLGKPLLDDLEKLTKLVPVSPVWLDSQNKRVVLIGQVCQTDALLELFACLTATKEHEAILVFDTKAEVVHAGLLAIGAEPGRPVQFLPVYIPAQGTEVEITLKWKDEKGEVQTARAQEWIIDTKTGKEMKDNWVFAGSRFWQNDKTGKEFYMAEGGEFICVSNFPNAMLDVPVESTQTNDQLLFRANSKRIPPIGTPVTMILTPKPEKKPKDTDGDSDSADGE
jgi:hypothetical protein